MQLAAIKRWWNALRRRSWPTCSRAICTRRRSKSAARSPIAPRHGQASAGCRTGKFYFIEVNPRIQVEHTVTECVTGIDLVKAQIRIAAGARIGTPKPECEAEDIRVNAHALQCRVTTEDPENNFVPDYGRITAYRSPAGFGIRLDAGTAYAGAIITRFYDSLLVKVTAWSPTPGGDIARIHRACRVTNPRRVPTCGSSIQLIMHPRFATARCTTVHRSDARLFRKPPQA